MRRAARLTALGCCWWLLVGLPGCGGNLTGGSIPPGRAFVAGLVVRGDSALVPLSGAKVQLIPTPAGRQGTNLGGGGSPPPPPDWGGGGNNNGGGVDVSGQEAPGTVTAFTTPTGQFSATALLTGPTRMVVTPPTASGLSRTEYLLDIPAGDGYWVMAAPLPTGVSFAGTSSMEATPTDIDLRVGQAVQLQVRLIGGAPPSVVPSYLLRSDVGVVNAQGMFTAVRAGRGQLKIVVGPYQQIIPVVTRPVQ
ncbi:MAG: hypothetical protein HYU66_25830 [Armatimonadetes bacterium]|nr:hypothetical protein [Armatimonadota bacterium]